MAQAPESALTHLECPECNKEFDADYLQTYCQNCRSPLLARYDLKAAAALGRERIKDRPRGIWRWGEFLPVRQASYRLTLGEGDTPILTVPRLSKKLGLKKLFIKDESRNPTGTFKARGLAVAVSKAMELGVRTLVISTAGNAGGALAAYAARGRVQAHIFMPGTTPQANQNEVKLSGVNLHLVKGLITDAARRATDEAGIRGWFDLTTFKEPYRVEGKKTMGFELAETFGWELPDVIIYPTGGGTGLVGMWKAFAELEAVGWIGSKRPRMVSVQAEGCAPIVHAFQTRAERLEPWDNPHTLAVGLCVPSPFADRLILRSLRESNGTAMSVSDDEITNMQKMLAQTEGILAAPEGAAALAALPQLLEKKWFRRNEHVVLFNTGSGMKYLE